MLKFYSKVTYNRFSLKWNPKFIKCARSARKNSQYGGGDNNEWGGINWVRWGGIGSDGEGDQADGGDSPPHLMKPCNITYII